MKIDTVSNRLEIISFKRFVELYVPRKQSRPEQDIVHFDTLLSYAPVSFYSDETSDSTYARCAAPLFKTDPVNAAYLSLVSQASFQYQFFTSAREIAEDMAVKDMENYGQGSLLVRLSKRKWFIADPSDFALFSNEKGHALIGYKKSSLLVFEVLRTTQAEALKSVQETLKARQLLASMDAKK